MLLSGHHFRNIDLIRQQGNKVAGEHFVHFQLTLQYTCQDLNLLSESSQHMIWVQEKADIFISCQFYSKLFNQWIRYDEAKLGSNFVFGD